MEEWTCEMLNVNAQTQVLKMYLVHVASVLGQVLVGLEDFMLKSSLRHGMYQDIFYLLKFGR